MKHRLTLIFLLIAFALGNLAAASSQPSASVTASRPTLLACEDEPKDRGFPRFARLMHDPQWMEYPSRMAAPEWPRTYYFNWYPETVQLYTGPHSGDGRVAYNKAWLEYLRDLQPSDSAAVWLTRIAAGLFNRVNQSVIPILNLDALKDEPVAEAISSGGNVVKVLEVKNGSGRIEMVYFRKSPPSGLTYQNKPWLVTKFTSVSIDGQLGNAGGIDVYFPNLAKNRNGYWVEMKRVEMFPQTPYCAVTRVGRTMLSAPRTGGVIGSVGAGQPITIREYLPQGSNVWGRIDGGWILLEYLADDGTPVFTTSWTMRTRPPILFP